MGTRTDGEVKISVRGRWVKVPSVAVGDRLIVVSGRWLRVAEIRDEAWLAGEVVTDPEACIATIRQGGLKADLFTFVQKLPNTEPRRSYPLEWDSVAAVPTSEFRSWWDRVPQETRKNVRRAGRRGVVVRETELNDSLLRGILEINNESPIRQGRAFWHYGKSLDEVGRDYASFGDRSTYFGAYVRDELVGFVKVVAMGEIAGILQLLCKHAHDDKRPANALMARAIEWSCSKGFGYLTYGQYVYGKKRTSPLTEFKRRNGFQEMLVPRYYVPLTARGSMALGLGAHRGVRELLPESLVKVALELRSFWIGARRRRGETAAGNEDRPV